jgi:tetratricopeptide (TPR) repeat protein
MSMPSGQNQFSSAIGVQVTSLNAETTNAFTHGFAPPPVGLMDRSKISDPGETVCQTICRDSEIWVVRGYGLHRLGNYEEAIVCFETAIEIQPTLANAWQGKGICLGELGESEAALQCFEQVILHQPNNYRGWHNRGKALMRVIRYDDAITCFKRVLQLKPENYKAWYNRGLCLDGLHHLEQALHSFDQALAIKPDCYYAWSGRGNTLIKLHRSDEASYSFDRSVDLRANNFSAWYGKATCYAQMNQVIPAIGSLTQAMNYAPRSARSLAQEDPVFENIRHEAAFQALFKTPDFARSSSRSTADLLQLVVR